MAHIENRSTQNVIVSHIKAESVRYKWRYAGNYWIGAVWDIAEPYTWVWENGKQLDYFHWDSHGTQRANAREAIKLGWSREFRWATGVATETNFYMCQSGPRCPEIHPEYSKLLRSDMMSSSYVCEDGYHMNGDGSFSTVCLPSGKWNITGGCSNIDECTLGTHNCSQHAKCTDLPGSFSCSCNSGYIGDGYNCNDIDECQTTNNCSSAASCTNINGGYTCSCNSGFTGDGYNCNDIDECKTTNNCSTSASCTNTNGGYTCSCNSGYTGDGYSCYDIDECKTTNNCSSSASCTNTYGGYTCSCNSGYTGDGYNCYDIDECKTTNNCSSSASCTNTNGGYTCSCNSGYTGDGYNCNDIDECKTTNNCSSSASCTNTNGGFTCSCISGYTGDGYTCSSPTKGKL
ncbi:adhesion G protein-coupled receptor E2-like [Lingula anatina]|uniref:Adhesion G protein-coupled receptor E2-like n=1 Tax=Lingula anatina TaxID=7574 RepID=A0A1S3J6X8_LINAN|nr:adhesion G protein-coupled receptor E2-like [Lingula anatina]|eukprot:XP_013405589.1 adhesion G protein-coupled receptor E2-like [Lingula anatina]